MLVAIQSIDNLMLFLPLLDIWQTTCVILHSEKTEVVCDV
jgi:hypothetical protein